MGDVSVCKQIMGAFASRTGLTSESGPYHRYLWTDAFAVCNYLELFRNTSEHDYIVSALRLVDQVHQILGRHREDDPRSGWISNLDEQEGRRHPTAGGLRIGKEINERRPSEPFDERMEWERDGQYFHYLTKWMHALDRTSHCTGNSVYSRWALELAKIAHAKFTYTHSRDQSIRMFWKMSIDLSYPLVASMGHHDPLDGLISYLQLQTTLGEREDIPDELGLEKEIAVMSDFCVNQSWATTDSLGIGGLLTDACKLLQLSIKKGLHEPKLLYALLEDANRSLEALNYSEQFGRPAQDRLAFRELGLSIGLHAVELMQNLADQNPSYVTDHRPLLVKIERLGRFLPILETIEQCWLNLANQKSEIWLEHQNINTIMLATSLAPYSYLAVT